MTLRTALANIHRDPLWWRKTLLAGALALSLLGLPWAAGLVVESMDNARKGYPTPLPPPGNWANRSLIGFFSLLIDLVFFVMPLLLAGVLLGCLLLGLSVSNARGALPILGALAGLLLGAYLLVVFALGVAPVGRLIYAEEGKPEAALGGLTLRVPLQPEARRIFGLARLRSLPAYLPALLLGALTWVSARSGASGAGWLSAALLWLTFSAVVYAHLVVAQLDAAAARELGQQLDAGEGAR
jgi:hypothetical protein